MEARRRKIHAFDVIHLVVIMTTSTPKKSLTLFLPLSSPPTSPQPTLSSLNGLPPQRDDTAAQPLQRHPTQECRLLGRLRRRRAPLPQRPLSQRNPHATEGFPREVLILQWPHQTRHQAKLLRLGHNRAEPEGRRRSHPSGIFLRSARDQSVLHGSVLFSVYLIADFIKQVTQLPYNHFLPSLPSFLPPS